MTGKARAAIRRATRDAVRAQYTGLGRQIVVRAFERAGKPFTEDKLKVPCRGWRAPASTTFSPPSAAARSFPAMW